LCIIVVFLRDINAAPSEKVSGAIISGRKPSKAVRAAQFAAYTWQKAGGLGASGILKKHSCVRDYDGRKI
jgi:hypothetical protein